MTRLFPAPWAPRLLSVLRIGAALLFVAHGTQKLFGVPGTRPPVELLSQMGVAGVLETFGGLLMLLGLFTGPIAFVLAGEMAVAYLMAHAPRGASPRLNGGELPLLYALTWLYFAAAGPGTWSLDALRRERAPERRNTERLAA
jgi:putative oxidoreductase